MNFKEFNQWTKDLYTPPQVDEAGDISNDRVLKFELSYGNAPEVTKYPILAITLAEALYRSIYTVLIESCPIESEINSASTEEDTENIKKRLISCLTFYGVTIGDCTEKSISFKRNDVVYTLTCDNYDFTKVYECLIEDDIVAVWEKPNDRDMICYVCYNMTNIAVNLKEVNKITNLMQLNAMVKNNLFTHANFLVSKFGFASITDEDVANDKYSNEFARDVSYKRALIDKLILDKKIIVEQLIALKHDFELLHGAIKRYYKINRKITKRISDLRKFVNDKISELYPDA